MRTAEYTGKVLGHTTCVDILAMIQQPDFTVPEQTLSCESSDGLRVGFLGKPNGGHVRTNVAPQSTSPDSLRESGTFSMGMRKGLLKLKRHRVGFLERQSPPIFRTELALNPCLRETKKAVAVPVLAHRIGAIRRSEPSPVSPDHTTTGLSMRFKQETSILPNQSVTA